MPIGKARITRAEHLNLHVGRLADDALRPGLRRSQASRATRNGSIRLLSRVNSRQSDSVLLIGTSYRGKGDWGMGVIRRTY